MKNICGYVTGWVCLFWIVGFCAPIVQASHLKGGDLYYTCLDPTNRIYRVFLTFYADCGGAAGLICTSPQGDLLVRGRPFGCSPQSVSPITTWTQLPTPIPGTVPQLFYPLCNGSTPLNQLPQVSPICYPDGQPFIGTTCNNPSSIYPGVIAVTWYADFFFPFNSTCTSYEVAFQPCCRTSALNTQFGSGIDSESTYISVTIPVTPGVGCNSSPQFTIPPVPYIFLNNTLSFNQGAIDPDGDSLAYRLDFCRTANGANLTSYTTFPPPVGTLSPQNPIPSIPSAQLDPLTGTLTLTPIALGEYVICLFVDEYRNGVLIGTVQRELQITVLNPTIIGNTGSGGLIELFYPPFVTTIVQKKTLPDGSVSLDTLSNALGPIGSVFDTLCTGTKVEYFIIATDTNATEGVVMSWSPGNGMQTATFQAPLQAQKNAQAIFTWPPTQGINSTQFVLTVKDNNCLQTTSVQYAFSFVVRQLVNVTATATVSCNQVAFQASQTNLDWQYVWTGQGGLTGSLAATSPAFSRSYPGPGTYPYTLRVLQGDGCFSEFTDVVTVGATAVVMDEGAGVDITVCAGSTYTIGSTSVPGQTYSWSVLGTAPAVLSSTTAANPVVTVFGPTDGQPDTVQVQVQASNGACEFQDVVSIVVLPQPLVAVSGLGATYCAGDTIALTAGPAEGYLWQASDPASLLSNTTGPTVQLKAVPDLSVSLLVFADGCSGLPITLSVPVVPLPVIEVLGPDRVCAGETVNLTAIGAETWLWPDGQTTSSVSFIPTRDTVVTLQGFNGGGLCAAAEVQRLVRYTTVPTPVLQAPDTVVCQEQSITFRALGTADRWEWQFDDGALASAANVQNPPVVRYLNTGTKTVRLRAYINGCPSAEVTRTLLVLPKTNIAIEPNPDQCFNEHGFTFRATDVPGSNYEWTFGPQGVVPTSAEPTPSGIRFQRPGSFSVGLRVFNEVCSEEATTRVTVLPSPNPPTVAPYDSLCPEFVLQLIATVPAGENLTWYADSSGTRVVGFGRRFTTPPATVTDTFYVRSTNRFGCQSFPTAVPVYRYPRVPLAIASPTRILYLPRAVGVLEPAAQDSQIIAWLWDIDRGGHVYTTQQAVHTFQRPGLYTVTLTTVDRFGCANAVIESDYFDVRELENLAIPNAFSPNGDRLNDEWFVYHLNVMDYTLRMFARDGGLVFETRDPNFRWDGTTPGGSLCPEGVYTYRIVARDYRGQPIERSGTVTLLR